MSKKKRVINTPQEAQPKVGLREFKPKTKNQAEYIRAIAENDITICSGPAGSGKTACAVGIAAEHLYYGKVKKLIITRPIVETGASMGYLPGDFKEKIHPYLMPILDELQLYFGPTLQDMIRREVIEIAPINFMRGRNFHDSFMLLDEAQNTNLDQIIMFLTRIGQNSKAVLNGDLLQSDIGDRNGLEICMNKLQDLDGVALIELTKLDIVRNPIIGKILDRLTV